MNLNYRIFITIGAVLVIAGLVLSVWAIVPLEGTKTRTIPLQPDLGYPLNPAIGMGNWILMKFSMWFNGDFSGSISATNAQGFDGGWKLISQSTYDTYKTEGFIGAVLFSHAGFNDTVSHVRLPTSGTYYLILSNNIPIQQEFDVTIHYRVSGVNLLFFVPGIALIVAGFVGTSLLYFANRRKKNKV